MNIFPQSETGRGIVDVLTKALDAIDRYEDEIADLRDQLGKAQDDLRTVYDAASKCALDIKMLGDAYDRWADQDADNTIKAMRRASRDIAYAIDDIRP